MSVPKRTGQIYSDVVINKICARLRDDYTLKEIADEFEWAPSYHTMLEWQKSKPEVKRKFFEARTIDLEVRKREELQRLLRADLDKIAEDCAKKDMPQNMRNQLFKLKVEHIYKKIETLKWELEIELPKKYGKRIQQDINFEGEVKNLSHTELRDLTLSFINDNRVQTLIKKESKDE